MLDKVRVRTDDCRATTRSLYDAARTRCHYPLVLFDKHSLHADFSRRDHVHGLFATDGDGARLEGGSHFISGSSMVVC